jgi:thiamine pyrophosphokinase
MNTTPKSRSTVIVADAPVANLDPFHSLLRDADLIIAADGGARHLLALDILPHIAVGDFDSLAAQQVSHLEQAGVEMLRHSVHKNETDLELALLVAIERDATSIFVLASLGGRPDQHLANLQLLTHPALATADVRLLHRNWEVFTIRRSARIVGNADEIVSLLPMTEAVSGITTEGLYYPLHDDTLRLGPARGVSNRMVGVEAHVNVAEGILLCMHELQTIAS